MTLYFVQYYLWLIFNQLSTFLATIIQQSQCNSYSYEPLGLLFHCSPICTHLKKGRGDIPSSPSHTFCCIISHELANRPFGRCRLDYLAWAGILQMHWHYKANAEDPPRCLGTWQNCCGFKFEIIWLPILCHDIRQMHSDLIGSIENYADWYQTVSFRGFMLPTNYAWREPRPGQ